jgi:hypothetical protein
LASLKPSSGDRFCRRNGREECPDDFPRRIDRDSNLSGLPVPDHVFRRNRTAASAVATGKVTFQRAGETKLSVYPASGPFNGTVTRSFELQQLGDVTVERPDWASKALNETND